MAMKNNVDTDFVIVINNEIMGHGDAELGGILIRSFLHTLTEARAVPHTLIFYNTGVKLVVDGSPVLADLHELQKQGVTILACGTCLGHFGLKEKIAAGEVSNMYDITDTLTGAGKVVTL